MALIIDGYNLLHETGLAGRVTGRKALEKSRHALVRFLAARLEPEELAATTVVFDAKDAPPGLPHTEHHRGLTIRYAVRYDDADELIEQLIGEEPTPGKLTVVSSDHRLHRAAQRRRATALDSEEWLEQILARPQHAPPETPDQDAKPAAALSAEETAAWLNAFSPVPTDQAAAHDVFPPGYADDVMEEE